MLYLLLKTKFGTHKTLLASTINCIVQGWLVPCQFKVTGWDIMFICGMVLRGAGTLKPGLGMDQLQQI